MKTIIVDSRQQIGKHDTKHNDMKLMGYNLLSSKLPIGDYAMLNNLSTIIDTKKDCIELFNNLTQSHIRFRNECIRAKENGIQLIILTEEQLPKGGLLNWKSPIYKSDSKRHKKGDLKTKANPETMRKIMITMQKNYGVKFLFCDKKDTGRFIVYLLTKES